MRIPALALLPLVVLSAPAEKKHRAVFYWNMRQQDVISLVHHVPQNDAIRLAQLRQTFHDLHCLSPDIQEQHSSQGVNLLCQLPGETPGMIVVAAHYQHIGNGESAVGDWSGSTMLPFLYHALTAQPRRHTYLFAAFAGEDGARDWMRSLTSDQRKHIQYMIALDALGLSPVSFYLHPLDMHFTATETTLVDTLELSARESGLPIPQPLTPHRWFRIDDTKQFRYRNIPSIVIYSEGADHGTLPGGDLDTAAAIQDDLYYDTYHLLCTFIAELDQVSDTDSFSSSPQRFHMW
ncbi:M28 family peptidase [Silvibacterium dinghuense]|uniref:M28 family peptidase n=1 Tax=Silvibacterium dinghuense TaxID=1560006 RepID=A0A4Q1SIC0_9BACT|nr:M28 family peptidase [Silvibacterium dinghuense]RXS96970.1 M28 family peptidase [Silvibacterium dinghuense]GGG95132.1 hypothetical protein GCM10011586_07650 [Silvibacterium dinghuense]